MKKIKLIILLLLAMVSSQSIIAQGKFNLRVLVAYYSKSGNTQKMAEYIAKCTGGDLLRIEPAVPYPDDKEKFVARAKEEWQSGKVIELKKMDVDLGRYDVIFIGSPVWFGDWAAPASSFARDPRLEGRKVIPFMTSGKDSRQVPDQIYKRCEKSEHGQGICIVEEKLKKGGEGIVYAWLCSTLGMKRCGELTTMNVMAALREMKCRYPKITLCDVYKSFYQDFFGVGHIVSNKETATKYIKEEMKEVKDVSVGVMMKCDGLQEKAATGVEKCGAAGRYVRVDLYKISSGEIKLKDYVDKLMQSVETKVDTAEWVKEWNFVLSVMQEYDVKVDDFERDLRTIEQRMKAGEYGMHHSKAFNDNYHPHYRIIKRELMDK